MCVPLEDLIVTTACAARKDLTGVANLAMPRGGSGKPDAYSPYKAADGRELRLHKSSQSQTGYHCIVKLRGKYYAKLKLDEAKGSRAQKLLGKGQETAREAAIILADFLDKPYALPSAPPRSQPATEQQQWARKRARLAVLEKEMAEVLGPEALPRDCLVWQPEPPPPPPVVYDGPVWVLPDHE